MESDLIVFFILFAVIFLVSLGLFIFKNPKDFFSAPKVRSRDVTKKNRPDIHKYTDIRGKICGYPEPTDESYGYVKLDAENFVFEDIKGNRIITIPYKGMEKIEIRFPGDNLNTRSNLRLMLPGWWSSSVPVLGKYNYLRIMRVKDGANELLSFTFDDKKETYIYLKDLCKEVERRSKGAQ